MKLSFRMAVLWIALVGSAANAQWNEWISLDSPSMSREQMVNVLDSFSIADIDRVRALAAHNQLLVSYEEANERARLGYRRVNEARTAWQEEHGVMVDPQSEYGLDFGSSDVITRQTQDRFDAEEAFRREVLSLPSIVSHTTARTAIVAPQLRRALRMMRIFESSTSPRFRDLDFLVDVIATCEFTEHGEQLLTPILASYTERLLPALSEWERHRATLSARYRDAQVYRIDLGTGMVETKFERMRAVLESDRAVLDRFIAINRAFTAQLLAAPLDETDREMLRRALEASRYPEYHERSPAHDVLSGLQDHPALTERQRASVLEIAAQFNEQWSEFRDRLIATATRTETSAFIARCDEVRLTRWRFADAARPAEHEMPVVIHPCEPLIVEREELVKSTLREVARLLNDDTIKRLDADIRLTLTWAAMGEA